VLILPDPSGAPPGRSVVRTLPRGCAPLTPGYVLAVPPGRRENAEKHFSQMLLRGGIAAR